MFVVVFCKCVDSTVTQVGVSAGVVDVRHEVAERRVTCSIAECMDV